jgi:Mrp family chromosome partitioning ATPase
MTRCIQVLDVLKAHFDWILIDTPPTIAVADASRWRMP